MSRPSLKIKLEPVMNEGFNFSVLEQRLSSIAIDGTIAGEEIPTPISGLYISPSLWVIFNPVSEDDTSRRLIINSKGHLGIDRVNSSLSLRGVFSKERTTSDWIPRGFLRTGRDIDLCRNIILTGLEAFASIPWRVFKKEIYERAREDGRLFRYNDWTPALQERVLSVKTWPVTEDFIYEF